MEQHDFLICGLGCRISCDGPTWLDDYSFRFLSSGKPLLEAVIRRVETVTLPAVPALGEGEFRQVWRNGGTIIRSSRSSRNAAPYFRADYSLDRKGRVDCVIPDKVWKSLQFPYVWPGIMLNYLLLSFRTLIFHASYIGYQGRGILFTAPSQTGKSTQAELWRVYRGAKVINGDKAGVRLEGAPMAHGVPFCGTSDICHNVSLPLGAVAVLSQAPVNSVRRLAPSEAAAALCGNVFVDHYIQEEWQMALNLLLDLVAAVPVYALACTPDVRAVEALEQAMELKKA